MTQLWTILDSAGAVVCACFPTPSYGSHPKDNGWPWAAGQAATRIDARPDPAIHVWGGSTAKWVESPALVETILIGDLKAEGERRKMLSSSAGGFKKAEYAAKRGEVIAWDSLGGTVASILSAFSLLPAALKATRFEYAVADAALRGDTVAAAIARFRGGMARAASTASISAVEARASDAIRAAATAAEKRAAAAVTWPS